MRKLVLTKYKVRSFDRKVGKEVMVDYDVRRSIENVMCASGQMTNQRLSMPDLLRNARIAQKITSCKKDFLLIEESEFQHLKASFNAFQAFGINEVELCKRIDTAETVEVQEKKEKKKEKSK